ncbi:hypothetical protein [Bacillus sp. LK2]|uniref:hypothetical protein n=1 Tax=Bacillus sp. LK2 TaxID=1628206 RepID=UPI0006531C49|nr:hypothetical protein [Bacillus sp. LK2]KMN42056.1 hypothetical protein VK90_26105 [Bacillus sp. LK2]
MKKKTLYIILVLFIFSLLYIYLHSTPIRSIRTAIFFTGHPIKAFQGKIREMEDINHQVIKYDGKTFYWIPEFQIRSTHIDVLTASVEKEGLLYKTTLGNSP